MLLTLDVAEGKKNSNHSRPVNCAMYSGKGVKGRGGGSGVGGGVGVFGGGGVGLLGGLVRRGEIRYWFVVRQLIECRHNCTRDLRCR